LEILEQKAQDVVPVTVAMKVDSAAAAVENIDSRESQLLAELESVRARLASLQLQQPR
jgi:hypothetical protein